MQGSARKSSDQEAHIFDARINVFHNENWHSIHSVIRMFSY